MDSSKNNLIVLAGAGILLIILFVFALTGAKSNPPAAGTINYDLESIPEVASSDNIRGSSNARVKLIEYSDIECPFCQEYHEELLTLTDREPLANFAWVYRHFPLTQIHDNAFNYAVATECAAEQNNFSSYLDVLVNRSRNKDILDRDQLVELATSNNLNTDKFSRCLDNPDIASRVQEEANQALAAGATGTPFSVLEFDRDITAAELENIQGLFGNNTKLVLSSNRKKLAIGGSIGSTQIKEIVNLVVDPAKENVVENISEGTN